MKGFSITPVLAVVLMLIAGLTLLTIRDIDNQQAAGIQAEIEVNRLGFELAQNRSGAQNLLFQYAAQEASAAADIDSFKTAVKGDLGDTEIIIDGCSASWVNVSVNSAFNYTIGRAGINAPYFVNASINCDAVKLYGASASITCEDGTTVFNCP